jgi:pimeloyl-ACP methyl ester carboxylesterase
MVPRAFDFEWFGRAVGGSRLLPTTPTARWTRSSHRRTVAEFRKPVLLLAGEHDVGLTPQNTDEYAVASSMPTGGAARRQELP